jgi:RNA polymerase sigma-70 factor (ECF subfamily)
MATEAQAIGAMRAADADLVARVEAARAGDHDAYGVLVEWSWKDLVRLARAVLARDDDAEDLVQETLVEGWRRLDTLRDPSRFGVWIRRALVRRCWRALRARPIRHYREPFDPQSPAFDPLTLDTRRLLGRLPPRQRAALYLTEVEGLSAGEAGAVLGLSAATVRVHRHFARRSLRRILAGETR